MKALLTYCKMAANLKLGMYVIRNDKFAVIRNMNDKEIVLQEYYDQDKKTKAHFTVLSTEQSKEISSSVVKFIAILDNKPISVIHTDYKAVFSFLCKFDKAHDDSRLRRLLNGDQFEIEVDYVTNPNKLIADEIVIVNDVKVINKFKLFTAEKRLFKVKFEIGNYVWKCVNVADPTISVNVDRKDIVKENNNNHTLVTMVDISRLIRDKDTVQPVKNNDPLANTYWRARWGEGVWYAYNKRHDYLYKILIPEDRYPVMFASVTNGHWKEGYAKMNNTSKPANGLDWSHFKEGLPLVGNISENLFRLNDLSQIKINIAIFEKQEALGLDYKEFLTPTALKALPNLAE